MDRFNQIVYCGIYYASKLGFCQERGLGSEEILHASKAARDGSPGGLQQAESGQELTLSFVWALTVVRSHNSD